MGFETVGVRILLRGRRLWDLEGSRRNEETSGKMHARVSSHATGRGGVEVWETSDTHDEGRSEMTVLTSLRVGRFRKKFVWV